MLTADAAAAHRERGTTLSPSVRRSTRAVADALEGKAVFVTGAGGFIGAALVRALVRCGATVTAVNGPPNAALAELPRSVRAVSADIEDTRTWQPLVSSADVVVHLAGPPSVGGSFTAPTEYARVHVGGTLAVLEACRSTTVSKLVYVSSAEVYGRPAAPLVSEEDALSPRSPYAASKAAAEHFVGAYVRSYGLDAVVLRPFSVYGPGLPATSVLATILRQASSDNDVVLADLAPVRDYVFVSDVVDAILRSAVAPSTGLSTFNVGSGIGTSVVALARLALELAGRQGHVRNDPSQPQRGNAQIYNLVADTTRIRQGLGWHPAVSLSAGVNKTLRWMEASRL